MKLKERETKGARSLGLEKLKGFGRFFVNRKAKIIYAALFVVVILVIGIFGGLAISGFFGTLDNPSQKALDIAHWIGIDDLRITKIWIEGIMAENIKIPYNYIKGQFSEPEKIIIDIGFTDYQEIRYKREQALERGFLVSTGADYVPATIKYNDKEVRVDLRLKGDFSDHWEGDKWSFRIKVKDGDTLFGMKTFSIQNPKTRNYLDEFIYHKALKGEGMMGIRYDFVEVVVNGENRGIYAIEEHFEKELIEDNQGREGVIIRFSEGLGEKESLKLLNYFGDDYVEYGEDLNWFYLSNIESFDDDKILGDPLLASQLKEAKNLLESFREGTLKTHKVFDVDILAKYFAISTVMRANHATTWNNIRFYYNPVTSRIEPIGYDGDGNINEMYELLEEYIPDYFGKTNYSGEKSFWDLIFEDEVFFVKYMQELERVSDKAYMDELFLELDEEIKKNTNILQKDNPFYHFPKETFYMNQKQLKYKLDPSNKLKSYFQETSEDKIVLYMGNLDFFPLEIVNLVYGESTIFELNQVDRIVQPKQSGQVNYQKFEFRIPLGFTWSDELSSNLRVNYKIFGTNKVTDVNVSQLGYIEDNFFEENFIRQEPISESTEFLEISNSSNEIYIKKGSWTLDESLIIPEGFTVFCDKGTTINLVDGALILSYSKLQFLGNEIEPIKIVSSDKTGQGLIVLNAEKESRLKHVYFKDLTNPSKQNWELTGAITFYESSVILENVIISGMGSEDSLNIIDSEFEIRDSVFENCLYDCLDVDFGGGIIEDSTFMNSGNDGLDFSGAKVNLKNIKIVNAGDKGISAGEKSEINAENIEIDGGYICVASKDLSEMNIKKISVSNCEYGFAAYQKKPEFGSASINSQDTNISSTENEYIVEKGSSISINGQIILGSKDKIYNKLYPGG